MPGTTPPTSQLEWLSSTTAMIVLFWSRAMRDLLKSFGWGIAGTPSIRYSDEVAIPRRRPHSVYRSPSRDCRRSERFAQRSEGRSTDVFRRDREFDVSALQGRLSTAPKVSLRPTRVRLLELGITTLPDAGPMVRLCHGNANEPALR